MRERRAYVCPHQDHVKANMAYRVFLTEPGPVPKCPEHGRPMERQTNKPYNVKATIAEAKALVERYKGAKKS